MNTLIISSIPTLAAILAIGAALARIVLTGNRSLARRIDDTNIRIDSLEDNLGKRIDENSSEIRALDAKFSDEFIDINHRFDVVNQRFDSVNRRFDAVSQRFDSVNQRIDKVLNLAQNQPSVA